MKISLLYQVVCYIRVKNPKKYQELRPPKLPCYILGFWYIRPLYNKIQLYNDWILLCAVSKWAWAHSHFWQCLTNPGKCDKTLTRYGETNVLFFDFFPLRLKTQEILSQVIVKNLDTGETVPLLLAEERLPKCINPLSLHIMRIMSEYVRYVKYVFTSVNPMDML